MGSGTKKVNNQWCTLYIGRSKHSRLRIPNSW